MSATVHHVCARSSQLRNRLLIPSFSPLRYAVLLPSGPGVTLVHLINLSQIALRVSNKSPAAICPQTKAASRKDLPDASTMPTSSRPSTRATISLLRSPLLSRSKSHAARDLKARESLSGRRAGTSANRQLGPIDPSSPPPASPRAIGSVRTPTPRLVIFSLVLGTYRCSVQAPTLCVPKWRVLIVFIQSRYR